MEFSGATIKHFLKRTGNANQLQLNQLANSRTYRIDNNLHSLIKCSESVYEEVCVVCCVCVNFCQLLDYSLSLCRTVVRVNFRLIS